MINRSVERDYDINYHSLAAHKAFEEALSHLTALCNIQYEPWATTAVLEEKWRIWKDKSEATLY